MSTTPVADKEVPVSCVRVSSEQANESMKQTTEAELAKLAELMKTQKIPPRRDIESDSDCDSDESDNDSSDEDYIPSKRKRVSQNALSASVETKMYKDNQELWKKINKYSLELNRTQKELHYLQLELNNKILECNDLKDTNSELVTVKKKFISEMNHQMQYMKLYNMYILITLSIFTNLFFNNKPFNIITKVFQIISSLGCNLFNNVYFIYFE